MEESNGKTIKIKPPVQSKENKETQTLDFLLKSDPLLHLNRGLFENVKKLMNLNVEAITHKENIIPINIKIKNTKNAIKELLIQGAQMEKTLALAEEYFYNKIKNVQGDNQDEVAKEKAIKRYQKSFDNYNRKLPSLMYLEENIVSSPVKNDGKKIGYGRFEMISSQPKKLSSRNPRHEKASNEGREENSTYKPIRISSDKINVKESESTKIALKHVEMPSHVSSSLKTR